MKEHYQDSQVSFSVELLEGEILTSVFEGSGSNKGTDQYLAWIEEAISIVGIGKLKVLMDLREQKSVPLRTQMKMGAWLMGAKGSIVKVAIVGGTSAARLVAKGAKVPIQFFDHPQKALGWLA
ncbi:MAG: hypothetical protein CMK59_10980 [Proteobacteria bacterium]|nr:hypothetical protein [Pseudomonadota bacterium]